MQGREVLNEREEEREYGLNELGLIVSMLAGD